MLQSSAQVLEFEPKQPLAASDQWWHKAMWWTGEMVVPPSALRLPTPHALRGQWAQRGLPCSALCEPPVHSPFAGERGHAGKVPWHSQAPAQVHASTQQQSQTSEISCEGLCEVEPKGELQGMVLHLRFEQYP